MIQFEDNCVEKKVSKKNVCHKKTSISTKKKREYIHVANSISISISIACLW